MFYRDGIIVSTPRRLIWLRDTDGDDVADRREEMLRGADDTDTHHGGYLARTPQGQVIYCEGLFHRGQFETPHGPVRTKDATALYLDPVTRELSIQRQTTHPNPWKISYNAWGEAMQMFGGGQIIDCDYYDVWTPVGTSSSGSMGMPFRDDKGCTLAWVSSPHFPKEWQGGLVTGHLLSKNAVLYTPLKIDGGTYVKADDSVNIFSSSNKVFRPTDLAFGLDGALYVSDFYYPIIGHAQHSIRDANRDYANGRIWRVTRKGVPLAKAPFIDRAPLNQLFSLLSHPQLRVRELARLELEKHPTEEVIAEAKSKIGTNSDVLRLELLWLFERAKDYSQTNFFKSLVKLNNLNVQRSAARSLRWWAPVLSSDARAIASQLAASEDDRTRMAVISVASYLQVGDKTWREFIHNVKAEPDTPLGKVVSLASLYDTPPLKPQFPLLRVDQGANLSGWLMNGSGRGGSLMVKSERPQDLVLGYRGNAFMNLDLNNIPLQRATGSQHTKNGQLNVTLQAGENKIEFYIETDGRGRTGRIDLYLANLVGGKPDGLTFARDATEHLTWTRAYDGENAPVTESRIRLKAVPAKMAFNVTEITVKPDHQYTFTFENPDHMLHSVVITKPGQGTVVGEMVDAMTNQPDAMAKHFIPDTDLILFATPQIPFGGKFEKEFTTPSEPGRYPFICTFPGHWRLMSGVIIVEDLNNESDSKKEKLKNAGHSRGMMDPKPVLDFIKKHNSAAEKSVSIKAAWSSYVIDSQEDWLQAAADHSNLEIKDGSAVPTAANSTFRSVLLSSDDKRSVKSLSIDQSPVWHNWEPIPNIGPSNLGDAPVMLNLGPGNYWMFGRYGSGGRRKGFKAEVAEFAGFEVPLVTTPFKNQYDAAGGLKKGLGGYHAWQSKDMINWVHHGPVTEGFSSWVTTAEYADGKLYIYYDYPNDQDPHLYIDEDLTDGIPGKNMGMAFEDPSHGSDCAFIRDLQGNFHVIYEDWGQIDASTHSWDSPLAGHAVSSDGIGDFKILPPAVDVRTNPTGRFAEYPHPHWHATDPKRYPGKPAPVDVPQHRIKAGEVRAFGKYEIHEPEQNAFGDWASICIGGQYYLFADYHPAHDRIRVGWFTSSSLDEPFTFCGEIGRGHPDPDIMFAEGQFYLATQMSKDYLSPGPWVETVEVRVGVDTDNDGSIDHWSDWQHVKESYGHIPGFSKQVAKTPAQLDLSQLPEGYGFQFELRLTDSTENRSKPILDRVTLSF